MVYYITEHIKHKSTGRSGSIARYFPHSKLCHNALIVLFYCFIDTVNAGISDCVKNNDCSYNVGENCIKSDTCTRCTGACMKPVDENDYDCSADGGVPAQLCLDDCKVPCADHITCARTQCPACSCTYNNIIFLIYTFDIFIRFKL